MKIKSLLLAALVASVFAVGSASANIIVSYGGNSLGMFSDTGTLLKSYSTALVDPRGVVTDNSGHVYVAEFGNTVNGTVSYNGNVKMYDIASGTFIRNILAPNLYAPTGVAFNPANPGEIILVGEYNASASQLGRWNTNATYSFVVVQNGVTAPYAGLYYNPTISGGAPEGIYGAAPAGNVVQQWSSGGLGYVPPNIGGVTGPTGITGLGTDLFFTGNTGSIVKYSGGNSTLIYSNPDNYAGITNDGTSLWISQYTSGYAARYSTTGTLETYFALANPTGIAYTTVPEPGSWALLALSLTTAMVLRRRRH